MKNLEKMTVSEIIAENERRSAERRFDPMTGVGAPGRRVEAKMECPVLGRKTMFLPETMLKTEVGRSVMANRGVAAFSNERGIPAEQVSKLFELVRLRHDFAYWASKYGLIRPKRGGENVPLVLNFAQRKLISELEEMRVAEKPIRAILLKARQWGGSTAIQLYMVWLQLTGQVGLNSLIVAHQTVATEEIRAMMKRVVDNYPEELLCVDFEAAEKGLLENRYEPPKKKSRRKKSEDGDEENEGEKKSPLKAVGRSGNTWHLPARNCDFKIGTAERPDSSRGGSYSLIHLSEVGIWRATEGKKPSEIVISATSGVLPEPGTMIVLESTAKGVGTYFHKEYKAAKKGIAQWKPIFIAWYNIEQYSLPIENPEEFARELIKRREDTAKDSRSESGRYLWELWESGATLEAINWYIWERKKYDSSSAMASEYPSNDIEAFASSGSPVFNPDSVERMIAGSRDPDIRESRNVSRRIWEPYDHRREYLGSLKVGKGVESERSVLVIIDVTTAKRPRVVAEGIIRGNVRDLARAVKEFGGEYGWCPIAIVSESGDVVEVGYTDYAADILNEEYPYLYAAGRQRLVYELDLRTKVKMTESLSALLASGGWEEPSKEAAEQFQTLEADPNAGYRPAPEASDDLLLARILGSYISLHEM